MAKSNITVNIECRKKWYFRLLYAYVVFLVSRGKISREEGAKFIANKGFVYSVDGERAERSEL